MSDLLPTLHSGLPYQREYTPESRSPFYAAATTPNNEAQDMSPEAMKRATSLGLARSVSLGAQSNNSTTSAGSLDSQTSERFRKIVRRVQMSKALSSSFKTLRDMTPENTIHSSQLERIQGVGSGTFATGPWVVRQGQPELKEPDYVVEISWLHSEDGSKPPHKVAVKRLRPEMLRHRKDLQKFYSEAALLRKLKHRNIVNYVGVGSFGGEDVDLCNIMSTTAEVMELLESMFLVQEYVEGGSLRDRVSADMYAQMGRERTYSDAQAGLWLLQAAEGLTYLHSSIPRVMHRDLKLDNILLRKMEGGETEALLVDFGVSAFMPNLGDTSQRGRRSYSGPLTRESSKRTSSGSSLVANSSMAVLADQVEQALQPARSTQEDLRKRAAALEAGKKFEMTGRTGSFLYMAPEMVRNEHYNEKADVFSFGVIVFEVMSRTITSTLVVGPTGNKRAAKLYARKVADGHRPQLPKTFPLRLCDLISRCWEQNADLRPSMEEVRDELAAMVAAGIFSGMDAAYAQANRMSGCGCCVM